MKRIIIVLSILVLQSCFLGIIAQNQLMVINKAVDACSDMQTAIASGSTESLRSANKTLKSCNINSFNSLRLVSGEPVSLNGHFVFDEVFVDSLIMGRDVYEFAQRYADDNRSKRGVSSDGRIFTKTCAVAGRAFVKYSFVCQGYHELAVVTEPGGMVNVVIHDKSNDMWYRDTKNLDTGKSVRTFAFDLPEGKACKMEIEITNVSAKDISFVIISN